MHQPMRRRVPMAVPPSTALRRLRRREAGRRVTMTEAAMRAPIRAKLIMLTSLQLIPAHVGTNGGKMATMKSPSHHQDISILWGGSVGWRSLKVGIWFTEVLASRKVHVYS
jgi:hypothetical protein